MAVNEVDMTLLASANNHLAIRLHSKFSEAEGNVFFSPFSISVALSMLFRGTQESTASELSQFLGFDDVKLSPDKVHNSFGNLLQLLAVSNEFYTLSTANAVAYHTDFDLLDDYKDDLQKIYRALALEVDFVEKTDEAVEQINDFVSKNTNGMIPKLLEKLDQSTVMVLLNAVYFKGTWLHQFDKAHTYPMPFFNKGQLGNKKDVPMMFLEKQFPFLGKDTFKALELPYKGDDLAMLLLLPQEMNGLKALENSLDSDFIQNIRKEMSPVKVNIKIPKLHLEYSKELKPVCKSLGLNKIFNPGANFSGLSNSAKLVVSSIVHKAVLDVNEKGSEAAAATAIVMVLMCIQICPEFHADHPFLFVIYNKQNNIILFMGHVDEL